MLHKSLGKLYIAATPIGNLDDVSRRFCQLAEQVDGVLCEDTRHSKKLFFHLGINPRLEAFHQHNEDMALERAVQRLLMGEKWMLISDAGTPMIQDPGFKLVRECHRKGIEVNFIPGACAVIAALCLSGQPTNEFQFIGYLPAKESKRRTTLARCVNFSHSAIFYLSAHRVIAEMRDVLSVYGEDRDMSLVKEITKVNEKVVKGCATEIIAWLEQSPLHLKGEFVLVIEGLQEKLLTADEDDEFIPSALSTLCISELRQHMPLKLATKITAKITAQSHKALYRFFMDRDCDSNP